MDVNKNTKKRKRAGNLLSLASTPDQKGAIINTVINLVSDSEEDLPPGDPETLVSSDYLDPLRNVECLLTGSEIDTSFSSTETIIYGTPGTPKSQRTPKSNSSDSSKRFSPYKKRMVIKRSPVKRNLAKEAFDHHPNLSNRDQEDKEFKNMFKAIDDKTNFFQQIICKYLNTNELRNLLDKESDNLLSSTVQLDILSMRLVCRLYWYKRRWYKMDKLVAIAKGKQALSTSDIQGSLQELIKYGFITLAEERKTNEHTIYLILNVNCHPWISATTRPQTPKQRLQMYPGLWYNEEDTIQLGNSDLNFDECINLLNMKQCNEICKSLNLKYHDPSKKSTVSALSNYCRTKPINTYFIIKNDKSGLISNSDRVLKLMRDKVGPCYKLSVLASETLDKLYLLMYLGMDYTIIREKKLEFTLINDKSRTEIYPIDKSMYVDNASVVFKTQTEFKSYFEVHNIYEDFLMQSDVRKKLDIIKNVYEMYNTFGMEEMKYYKALPVWLRRFTPAYLYIKIIEKGVEDMKRQGDYHQLAVDMLTTLTSQSAFRQHKKGEWFSEKALILHKYLRQYDMAGATLLQGLQCDMPKVLRQALLQRVKQLVSQKNIKLEENIMQQLLSVLENELLITEKDFSADHVYKQHMDFERKGKKKFKTRDETGATVQDAENYCISYYISKGLYTDGRHWEGNIVTTIFTLLFWDIIYIKLRGYSGIFLTAYQVYPLDMYYPSFYENRKEIIDERLTWIENSSTDVLREEMRKVWDSRPECEISGINRRVGWECVCEVCECAGGRHLAALCRRLATDYAYANSGFPDLTLWNTNTKQIKFVEVKTDTDKPSIKQLQWMHYLKSVGIDTGFCYVGVNTKRSKARNGPSDRTDTI